MKPWKIVYTVLVCTVLALPLLLLPVAKSSAAEKRALAAFPTLVDENGVNGAFTTQLDTWMSEHFPFRSEWISANNYWKAALFATSDEQQVIVGKEDWLYFADTLPDYFGENGLSDTALGQIRTTLSLMNEAVTAAGGRFVFAVAPNKNTVYPAYMPARYQKATAPGNLERLTALLQGETYFADLLAALQPGEELLYHQRDTHWNTLGALMGYRAMMKTAGRDTTPFDEVSYTWHKTHRGDLDDMIFPASSRLDDQAVLSEVPAYTITSNYHSEEDLLITTENEDGEGSLLFFRDSFGNALLPLMAGTYATTTLSRVSPYDLREVGDYDTVMLEIVERNLANLLTTAPVMTAPTRTDTLATPVEGAQVFTRQKYDLCHVYGTLPQAAERVYLQLTKGEDTVLFEAFPLYEQTLLGEDAPAAGGFSAYVPPAYAEYTVTVLT